MSRYAGRNTKWGNFTMGLNGTSPMCSVFPAERAACFFLHFRVNFFESWRHFRGHSTAAFLAPPVWTQLFKLFNTIQYNTPGILARTFTSPIKDFRQINFFSICTCKLCLLWTYERSVGRPVRKNAGTSSEPCGATSRRRCCRRCCRHAWGESIDFQLRD